MNININVNKDFSEYPGLRYHSLSDYSGEDFYHDLLNKKFVEALKNNTKLIVNLDGTAGYAPSFLDEAFGNLVFDFSEGVVRKHIKIISTEEPYWLKMIEDTTYHKWEERKKNDEKPKKTVKHDPWFCLDNGSLIEISEYGLD